MCWLGFGCHAASIRVIVGHRYSASGRAERVSHFVQSAASAAVKHSGADDGSSLTRSASLSLSLALCPSPPKRFPSALAGRKERPPFVSSSTQHTISVRPLGNLRRHHPSTKYNRFSLRQSRLLNTTTRTISLLQLTSAYLINLNTTI